MDNMGLVQEQNIKLNKEYMFGVEWNHLKLAKKKPWQEKKNTEAIIPKTWQEKKNAEPILSEDQSI